MDRRHDVVTWKVATADVNGANCQRVCVTLRSQSGDLDGSGRSGLGGHVSVWLVARLRHAGCCLASIVLQSPARSSACKSDDDDAVQRRLLLPLPDATTTTTTTRIETKVYNHKSGTTTNRTWNNHDNKAVQQRLLLLPPSPTTTTTTVQNETKVYN